MKQIVLALGFLTLISCQMNTKNSTDNKQESNDHAIGSFEKIDDAFHSIVGENATIEILAEGYTWSEGPVWVEEHKMLLFSDVPENTIFKWTAEKGAEVYLTPSGYTGEGDYSREPGSNGLTLTNDGQLVLCQHGDRKVVLMDAPLDAPQAKFITLADQYEGKKLSSPNDVVVRSNGDFFFTDPPYGLPKQAEDPTKETPFNGVYKIANGTTTLIVDSLTRPNGIAFLKGEKTLLVANSDSNKAAWYAFDLDDQDNVSNARIFYDATSNSKAGEKGLPDGFRVDKNGNVFATGPGGIWIFNNEGKVLGKIKIKEATSNCALADDDKTLYITADMYLLRVKLRD